MLNLIGDKVKTLTHIEEMNAPSIGKGGTMPSVVKKEPSLLFKEEQATVKVLCAALIEFLIR